LCFYQVVVAQHQHKAGRQTVRIAVIAIGSAYDCHSMTVIAFYAITLFKTSEKYVYHNRKLFGIVWLTLLMDSMQFAECRVATSNDEHHTHLSAGRTAQVNA